MLIVSLLLFAFDSSHKIYHSLNEISGTTCATVLTRAIFTEGCKSVAAGMNAMDLRRGITMAVDAVVTNLKSRARMISTSEEIAQVFFYFLVLFVYYNAIVSTKCYTIWTALYFKRLEQYLQMEKERLVS